MKLHDIESIAMHFNIEYDTSAYMTNGFLVYKNIRIAEFKKDEEKIYFMLKLGLDRTYMRKPDNVFRRVVPRADAPVKKLIETYCVPVFKDNRRYLIGDFNYNYYQLAVNPKVRTLQA